MACFWLLATSAQISSASVVDTSFVQGVDFAKVGNFARAAAEFQIALNDDPQHVDSLHSLATMQMISADLESAVSNHQKATSIAKTMPPLAKFFSDKVDLGGLEKIYYVASAQKKKLSDTALAGGSADKGAFNVPAKQLYQSHKQMAALLEHSGFIAEALTHYDRAVTASPLQLDMRLHTALTLPVVYGSLEALRSTRVKLEAQLVELRHLLSEGVIKPLTKITSFATPSIFYIAYFGAEDFGVMTQVAAIYEEAAPDLVDHISPHMLLQQEDAAAVAAGGAGGAGHKHKQHKQHTQNKQKVRVGFLSPSLHEHSVCTALVPTYTVLHLCSHIPCDRCASSSVGSYITLTVTGSRW
jgi:tetratricopeptide (TPR) repeat protein